MSKTKTNRIKKFGFEEGLLLNGKYRILEQIGSGWEGEVYRVEEKLTGIERAAKFFYPHRNKNNKTIKFYAKKLHKLRNCPALLQYITQESMEFSEQSVHFLISEFVEGETLDNFLKRQKGKRLSAFQGLHLLHSLACALEEIHRHKDYHGDLHEENIMVSRFGLGFDLKLIDVFHWGTASPENIKGDICDAIRVFYDVIGGQERYSSQPDAVKQICCGLKKSLILKKFRSSTNLRAYIENLRWET